MGKSTLYSVLAFSALVVLALGMGRESIGPHQAAGQSQPVVPASVSGEKPGTMGQPGAEETRRSPADPVQGETSDCEDCVIVWSGAEIAPEAAGPDGRPESMALVLLAGTLWGLFGVSRPKGMPRTFIRGVTVP
jgi:hypothetical protein